MSGADHRVGVGGHLEFFGVLGLVEPGARVFLEHDRERAVGEWASVSRRAIEGERQTRRCGWADCRDRTRHVLRAGRHRRAQGRDGCAGRNRERPRLARDRWPLRTDPEGHPGADRGGRVVPRLRHWVVDPDRRVGAQVVASGPVADAGQVEGGAERVGQEGEPVAARVEVQHHVGRVGGQVGGERERQRHRLADVRVAVGVVVEPPPERAAECEDLARPRRWHPGARDGVVGRLQVGRAGGRVVAGHAADEVLSREVVHGESRGGRPEEADPARRVDHDRDGAVRRQAAAAPEALADGASPSRDFADNALPDGSLDSERRAGGCRRASAHHDPRQLHLRHGDAGRHEQHESEQTDRMTHRRTYSSGIDASPLAPFSAPLRTRRRPTGPPRHRSQQTRHTRRDRLPGESRPRREPDDVPSRKEPGPGSLPHDGDRLRAHRAAGRQPDDVDARRLPVGVPRPLGGAG